MLDEIYTLLRKMAKIEENIEILEFNVNEREEFDKEEELIKVQNKYNKLETKLLKKMSKYVKHNNYKLTSK